VRGPLTAAEFGLDVAYGDPGLLVPLLTGPVRKRWSLSYVPHWSDSRLLDEAYRRKAHVIDVRRSDVLHIAREIAASEQVVASSLHGVIVADAFGVAAEPRLAPRSERREGGDFKWRDYHASLDLEPCFGQTRLAPADRVAEMREMLVTCFEKVTP
jgi:pyruvyltransferase